MQQFARISWIAVKISEKIKSWAAQQLRKNIIFLLSRN
jgi:hypothetical protein